MKIANWKLKIIAGLLLCGILLAAVPATASAAFSLVPCGQSDYSTTPPTIKNPCTLRLLITMIVRLINYLVSCAAIVAMYQILSGGWTLMTAMGSSEKIEQGKTHLKNAVVGFAAVVLSFIFINLLVNGVLGDPRAGTQEDKNREWWDPRCIYDVSFTQLGCPYDGSANNK